MHKPHTQCSCQWWLLPLLQNSVLICCYKHKPTSLVLCFCLTSGYKHVEMWINGHTGFPRYIQPVYQYQGCSLYPLQSKPYREKKLANKKKKKKPPDKLPVSVSLSNSHGTKFITRKLHFIVILLTAARCFACCNQLFCWLPKQHSEVVIDVPGCRLDCKHMSASHSSTAKKSLMSSICLLQERLTLIFFFQLFKCIY